jgi:hypothetical protein
MPAATLTVGGVEITAILGGGSSLAENPFNGAR